MYVPTPKGGRMTIGVAVADQPTGPFVDAVGAPLIDNPASTLATGGVTGTGGAVEPGSANATGGVAGSGGTVEPSSGGTTGGMTATGGLVASASYALAALAGLFATRRRRHSARRPGRDGACR